MMIMSQSRLQTFMVVVFTLLATSFLSGCTSADTEQYKIGVIAPLSNAGTNLGQPWVTGIEAAINEINAKGGVRGKKVELLVEDSKFQGKTSATAAHSLLRQNVDIGTVLFNIPTNSVNPIFDQKEVPLHHLSFTRGALEQNNQSFKAHFDGYEGCQRLIKYAKNNDAYNKLGVLMSQTEYGDLCVKAIKTVEPNVSIYRYESGTKDFRTILTKAQSDNVDALSTILVDPEAVNLFEQITELGYDVKIICATAGECIYPSVQETTPADVLNGTVSIDFIPPNITDHPKVESIGSENLSFTKASWIALGYEEMQYITKALEECKPRDHQCITEQMKEVSDYNSILDTNGFKNRRLNLSYDIYRHNGQRWKTVAD